MNTYVVVVVVVVLADVTIFLLLLSRFRMEIWQILQEELNRLYEMFVQRNPYFEANGGKVSIVAHSLGCVVTYDILTGT